jgi:hypothetical protein
MILHSSDVQYSHIYYTFYGSAAGRRERKSNLNMSARLAALFERNVIEFLGNAKPFE